MELVSVFICSFCCGHGWREGYGRKEGMVKKYFKADSEAREMSEVCPLTLFWF